ncbi:MAG TPA: hypothetical protein VK132_07080, partial [Gemmatimonadales bacterium]|nr:hypothetical protein [Gemmatimonadales bacterium]
MLRFAARLSLIALLSAVPGVRLGAQVPRIAVERRLARELDLHVGDTLRIGPAPDSLRARAVVGAIYEPRPDPAGVLRPDR